MKGWAVVANLSGIIFSQIYGDNSGGAEFDTDGDGTATQEDEFVSVQNTTGSTVDVSGWQIWSDSSGAGAPDGVQDGLYHTFPSGTTLAPGETLYIINEITGTPASNMQEASEGGVESGAGGANTNLLSEGDDQDLSEGVALLNPATGEYIVLNLSANDASNYEDQTGFTGTTLVGTSNAAADSGQEDMNAGSSYQYNSATDSYEYAPVSVVCFAAGMRIAVPGGERPVEELMPGDPVLTLDHGVQILKKTLSRTLIFAKAEDARHKPIEFKPGSLGSQLPNRTLIVSPQHRMLVQGRDGADVLVPAKALTKRKGVRTMKGCRKVIYIQLVFAQHEIVTAQGCWSESFYPGAYVMSTFGPRIRSELMEIFPQLKNNLSIQPARSLMRAGEAQTLFSRNCNLHTISEVSFS